VKNGKKKANNAMEHCTILPVKDIPLSPTNDDTVVGPLWLGPLEKKSILQELRTLLSTKEFKTKNSLWVLLNVLEEEADAPPFFYTTSDVGALLKQSSPSRSDLFKGLHERGYVATRTHFHPLGFKTTAPFKVIKEVFKRADDIRKS